jgi:hypothetical protein
MACRAYNYTPSQKEKHMAKKKPAATTRKTPAQLKGEKAVAAIEDMVKSINSDDFDSLCGKGQRLVVGMAEAIGADTKSFADDYEHELYIGGVHFKFPGVVTELEDYNDVQVDITITHKPTGKTVTLEDFQN